MCLLKYYTVINHVAIWYGLYDERVVCEFCRLWQATKLTHYELRSAEGAEESGKGALKSSNSGGNYE